MKVIHITPSYKPAYVYGGPTMSIAKLCEALEEQRVKNKEQGTKIKDQRLKTKAHDVESVKLKVEDLKINDREKYSDSTNNDSTTPRLTTNEPIELQVLTTTANRKEELNVPRNEPQLVDGVLVTYFKRITKDHTHFSPALLLALRKEIIISKKDRMKRLTHPVSSSLSFGESREEDVIIHIHSWWNLVSVLSCAVAKWYKVPVVLSPRGMLNSYSQTHKNSMAKNLLNQTIGKNLLQYCHLHFTSAKEKTNILPFLVENKKSIIPNLIQLQKIETEKLLDTVKERKTKNEQDVFKLIFLGRIEKIKGLDILFQSLAELEINYTLTIAGTGEQNYIESLKLQAKSLKIDSKIDWIGQVKNDDKFNFFGEHDLMVLTSYNENFANVVIESLSVGTPVLVSKYVGLADYVIENNFGWVTNLQSEVITRTILEASKDLEKRKNIRTSAPQKIAADFDDAILAKRYLEMYEDVLKRSVH